MLNSAAIVLQLTIGFCFFSLAWYAELILRHCNVTAQQATLFRSPLRGDRPLNALDSLKHIPESCWWNFGYFDCRNGDAAEQ